MLLSPSAQDLAETLREEESLARSRGLRSLRFKLGVSSISVDRPNAENEPIVVLCERRGKRFVTGPASPDNGSSRTIFADSLNLDILFFRRADYQMADLQDTSLRTQHEPLGGFDPALVRFSIRKGSVDGPLLDCAALNLSSFVVGARGAIEDQLELPVGFTLRMCVSTTLVLPEPEDQTPDQSNLQEARLVASTLFQDTSRGEVFCRNGAWSGVHDYEDTGAYRSDMPDSNAESSEAGSDDESDPWSIDDSLVISAGDDTQLVDETTNVPTSSAVDQPPVAPTMLDNDSEEQVEKCKADVEHSCTENSCDSHPLTDTVKTGNTNTDEGEPTVVSESLEELDPVPEGDSTGEPVVFPKSLDGVDPSRDSGSQEACLSNIPKETRETEEVVELHRARSREHAEDGMTDSNIEPETFSARLFEEDHPFTSLGQRKDGAAMYNTITDEGLWQEVPLCTSVPSPFPIEIWSIAGPEEIDPEEEEEMVDIGDGVLAPKRNITLLQATAKCSSTKAGPLATIGDMSPLQKCRISPRKRRRPLVHDLGKPLNLHKCTVLEASRRMEHDVIYIDEPNLSDSEEFDDEDDEEDDDDDDYENESDNEAGEDANEGFGRVDTELNLLRDEQKGFGPSLGPERKPEKCSSSSSVGDMHCEMSEEEPSSELSDACVHEQSPASTKNGALQREKSEPPSDAPTYTPDGSRREGNVTGSETQVDSDKSDVGNVVAGVFGADQSMQDLNEAESNGIREAASQVATLMNRLNELEIENTLLSKRLRAANLHVEILQQSRSYETGRLANGPDDVKLSETLSRVHQLEVENSHLLESEQELTDLAKAATTARLAAETELSKLRKEVLQGQQFRQENQRLLGVILELKGELDREPGSPDIVKQLTEAKSELAIVQAEVDSLRHDLGLAQQQLSEQSIKKRGKGSGGIFGGLSMRHGARKEELRRGEADAKSEGDEGTSAESSPRAVLP